MMWISIDKLKEHIKDREMFVVRAFDIPPWEGSNRLYTSDPYCVWLGDDGRFARWPFKEFQPTHFCLLPGVEDREELA